MELDGITCLVTGANRGIGHHIARELATRPVRLLAGVRDLERWQGLGLGHDERAEVVPVQLDLSSRDTIERDTAALGDRLGEIELLVNNAGTLTAGQLETQDLAAIYEMVQVNLVAAMHLTQKVLPAMLARGHGKIVNQASIIGYAHFPGASTYAATKAGLVAFTESLRRELDETGVEVLELVTGGVETDMLDEVERLLADNYADTSSWEQYAPGEWAAKVVDAIEGDETILGPGGKAALGKLASRGPAGLLDGLSRAAFSRA